MLPVALYIESMQMYEDFEDTKRVIRIRNSKKDRQHWPKEKGQTTIYKTLHIKLKIK